MATVIGSSPENTILHRPGSPSKDPLRIDINDICLEDLPKVVPTPSRLDARSDEEILEGLSKHHVVTSSEKNIWAFWHSGLRDMRPWAQRNVIGWVRKLGPEWRVRVLDMVEDSPNNVYRFCDKSWFPQAFNENTMRGLHIFPHMADMVRLPCVYLYGGIWIDVGAMLLRNVHDICWNILEDPDSPYELAGFRLRPGDNTMVNSFIASKKENPFLKRWHAIFLEIWKDRTECKGIHKHPLLRHLPLSQHSIVEHNAEDLSDYIAQCICFHRLRLLIDPSDGFNGVDYFENKIFMLDCWEELYAYQKMTGWDGKRSFELLSRKRDEQHLDLEAEKMVQYLIAQCCMMKVSHGIKTPLTPLAELWDANPGADAEEGTFAGFLRWASIHLEQTRQVTPLRMLMASTEEVLHVPVLEVQALW